jgi:hypothetical protein
MYIHSSFLTENVFIIYCKNEILSQITLKIITQKVILWRKVLKQYGKHVNGLMTFDELLNN